MDGDRIITSFERAFVAWLQALLSLVIAFYRPPRSFFGSFGYEAKHLAMLATVAWFLNKTFGPMAVVVWVAGSYLTDWLLKKYDTN